MRRLAAAFTGHLQRSASTVECPSGRLALLAPIWEGIREGLDPGLARGFACGSWNSPLLHTREVISPCPAPIAGPLPSAIPETAAAFSCPSPEPRASLRDRTQNSWVFPRQGTPYAPLDPGPAGWDSGILPA